MPDTGTSPPSNPEVAGSQPPQRRVTIELAPEQVSRLETLLSPPIKKADRRLDLIVIGAAAAVLVALFLIRVPRAVVDVELRATALQLDLSQGSQANIIPGETGQILSLKRAIVSGIQDLSPAGASDGDRLDLRAAPDESDKADLGASKKTDRSVRLFSITLPPNAPLSVDASVAYAGSARGVDLELQGNQPIEAAFGNVITLPSQGTASKSQVTAIQNIGAAGRDLRFSLFPSDEAHELAVFRNIRIAKISFESDGSPTILSGSLHIGGGGADVALRPSDRLVLLSKRPIILRELALTDGQLKAVLSIPAATGINLGDDQPRDLRPSLLQWLLFQWPNELYAVLSAGAALWIATRRWLRGAE